MERNDPAEHYVIDAIESSLFFLDSCLSPARRPEGLRVFNQPKLVQIILWKGGGPAAGSPTATLLRLSPDHRARRGRQPSKS